MAAHVRATALIKVAGALVGQPLRGAQAAARAAGDQAGPSAGSVRLGARAGNRRVDAADAVAIRIII